MRALAVAILLLLDTRASPSPTPRCFPAEAKVNDFQSRWYCAQLAVAGEAELKGDLAFRFTYLPSFDHGRVVTVSLVSGQAIVVGKVLSGKGGFEAGRLLKATRRTLTPDEWRLLQQRLENAGIWEPTDRQDNTGVDGATWLLEGRDRQRYRFHEVWSPTETTFPQYRRVCAYLLELARILPDDHELY